MEPIVAESVLAYKRVHEAMRQAVRGLDTEQLNWRPAPETNSVAVLVVHTLGSEREIIHVVADEPYTRDRAAEFTVVVDDDETLLTALDEADALLDELGPKITPADLIAERGRRHNAPETGLHWLVSNTGHAREHQGHLELTKQFYTATRGR